jgi:uncharacterized membrane protein YcaP (DUF421 family)
MFFDSWQALARIIVIGVFAYGALILLLRISGKRTLTKLNAFDLVITVALGSTLATILLSKQTPLVDGVVALALLIALQFGITWLSVHNHAFRKLVRSEPRLLLHRGDFLRAAMRHERINHDEILQALRSAGMARPEDAEAVVLETDGSLSVIGRTEQPTPALPRAADGNRASARNRGPRNP